MAEIYKEEVVTEEITHKKRIKIGVKCDVCGKNIKGDFWNVITSHNDWGNDSCDSVERFDVCSRECIDKKIDEYMQNCKHSYTQEFQLEQERWELK